MELPDYIPNITQRLQDIQNLKDGWHNGDGRAYNKKDIQWLEAVLMSFSDKIPEPKIYPWVNENISLEWLLCNEDITIEIDFSNYKCKLHSMTIGGETEDEYEKEYKHLEDALLWIENKSKPKPIDHYCEFKKAILETISTSNNKLNYHKLASIFPFADRDVINRHLVYLMKDGRITIKAGYIVERI